jgi:hypothetical protein
VCWCHRNEKGFLARAFVNLEAEAQDVITRRSDDGDIFSGGDSRKQIFSGHICGHAKQFISLFRHYANRRGAEKRSFILQTETDFERGGREVGF